MVVSVVTGPVICYDAEIAKFKESQQAKQLNIQTVKSPADFSAAVRSSQLTVVNFFKPSFNPCKYFNPRFQRMAAELGEHATFIQVWEGG